MDIIKNNPYRMIGILVGTSTRDEHTKSKKLKMYIEAEQEVPEDFSFPILGSFDRNLETVDDAVSKLNLNSDRVKASLFWFYNGNDVTDERVFDAIKASKEEAKEAVDVWIKLVASDQVTKKNASAFQNLSTLRLINNFGLYGKHNFKKLESGIHLKLRFLESDYIDDFIKLSTDETFKFSKENLQIIFLDQVYTEIQKYAKTEIIWYMDFLNSISFIAKEKYLTEFIKEPIERLKENLELSKKQRKTNEDKAYKYGKSLYEQSEKFLPIFKSILGENSLQYTSIADKFSDEILQCGIVYFKKYRDTDTDPSAEAMDLFRKAKTIAVGSVAIQRCQENTESLQEWIDEKPKREKFDSILLDFKKLEAFIKLFEGQAETVDNAKKLLANCNPYLIKIKSTLGASDELYLGLSTRIASDAQGMCVSEINDIQDKIKTAIYQDYKRTLILSLKDKVNQAWDVSNSIGLMDLRTDFRSHYSSNKSSLSSLRQQLANVKTGGGSGGGCYIATMAYGDYEHPQVKILREFRDNVLDKFILGKYFIRIYYKYSPKLVDRLRDKEKVNNFIRRILNQIIKIIK